MEQKTPEREDTPQLKESTFPEHQARVEDIRSTLAIKKPNSPLEDIHQEARDKVAAEIVRSRLRKEVQKAQESAIKDPLTEMYNRRFFDEQIARGMSQVNREPKNHRMFLTISDIDDYGTFNGTYGMSTGDEILKEIGKIYNSNIRTGSDTAARLGGEELGYLSTYDISSTGTQSLDYYIQPITRIQEKMEQMQIHDSQGNVIPEKITSSYGNTRYIAGEDRESFQTRSETALRFAKMLGKDRIVTLDPDPTGNLILFDRKDQEEYVYWTETDEGQEGKVQGIKEFIVNNRTGEQSMVVPVEKGKSKLVKIAKNNG